MPARLIAAGTAALLLLAAAPATAQCPDGRPAPCDRAAAARAPSANSVAVLYFDNLSRDTADQYLADGLTEEIINRLGEVRRLQVKSRYEVQRVRGQRSLDPAALGRSLNAAWLVTGSVQRGGDRIRVRVELLRAATATRAWGGQFDQPHGDVLAIEDSIGRGVAQGIAGTLLPEERSALARRPTSDNLAHDLYLRANALHDQYTEASLRAAIALYEQAIARDPRLVPAYRGLASAWSFLADDFAAPLETYPHAQRALDLGIAIDSSPQLLGWTLPRLILTRDIAAAERVATIALAKARDVPEPNWGMAWVRWAQGRNAEASAYTRHAWELDTLSFTAAWLHAAGLFMNSRWDELDRMRPLLRQLVGPGWDGIVRFGRGDCAGALADSSSASFLLRWYVVPAMVCAGRLDDARRATAALVEERRRHYVPGSVLAIAYAALGDRDEAFRWLEQALADRDASLLWFRTNPLFEPLRADARYADVARRLWQPGN